MARLSLPILALLALAACEPDTRNDAVIFLDRVQRLDLDDPIAQRRRLVESLSSLPLQASEVVSARDACVEAHETIIEAEELTANARQAVEEHEDESSIPIVERTRLEADIRRSNRLLERSRSMFSRCHRLTRDLEVRYRSRRRRAD